MFLSLDPDPGSDGDSLDQNGYAYGNNNPVINVDPDGHWVWLVVNAGFAAYDGYKAYKAGKGWRGAAWAAASNFGPGKIFKGAKRVYRFAKKVKGTKGYYKQTKSHNLSPKGAGRKGAFREAKRRMGIPVSAQPTKVTRARDKRGKIIPGKTYIYGKGKYARKILWHPAGHYYGKGSPQNRGRHYNDDRKNHYNY
ncbi:hypothetical protein AX282_16130 [Bacillus spizizenii]|nr:hypothetical protein AX282_16130 [Bacillus spizizenii]